MLEHTCHAEGCKTIVPPKMFMCRRHWGLLRPGMQRAIWREYKRGQEVRKDPSLRYLAVADMAIAEVFFDVRKLQPNASEAARWGFVNSTAVLVHRALERRAMAITMGKGDPLDVNVVGLHRELNALLRTELPKLQQRDAFKLLGKLLAPPPATPKLGWFPVEYACKPSSPDEEPGTD